MTRKEKNVGNFLFRVGKPRVTETLSKHFTERGTGQQGTGIYAYGSKSYAIQIAENRPIYKIDASKVKFFTPRNIIPQSFFVDGQKDFIRLSTVMNAIALAKSFNDKKWYGRSIEDLMNDAILIGSHFDFTEKQINEAINKTVKEVKSSDTTKASQPINHLLGVKGYGGVDPGKNLRDDNSVGIVVFRETFGIKSGEEENVKTRNEKEAKNTELNKFKQI